MAHSPLRLLAAERIMLSSVRSAYPPADAADWGEPYDAPPYVGVEPYAPDEGLAPYPPPPPPPAPMGELNPCAAYAGAPYPTPLAAPYLVELALESKPTPVDDSVMTCPRRGGVGPMPAWPYTRPLTCADGAAAEVGAPWSLLQPAV